MPKLVIAPHAGIIKRLPEHKIVSEKKQYLFEAINYISLDGKIKTMPGNEKYDPVAKTGSCQWAKRIYYRVGNDKYRSMFAVIGGKMYKGNDSTPSLDQVKINNSLEIETEKDIYLSDATIEVSGNVQTYLVDGRFFYKFIPNQAGQWDRLPVLTDVDGNDIEPIDIIVYQDRLWSLVKNRNVLLFSKNLEPENLTGLIQLPAGNGGFPQKMIVHNGFLFIVHEDYFTPVTGSSAATYGVRPGDIVYGYGTRAPRSICTIKQNFGFLNSSDNEYYLTAGTIGSMTNTPVSYQIQLGKLINPVKASETAVVLDPNIDCLRISYVPTGEAVLNKEAIYSINEEKWAGETYGKNIAGYCVWDGNGDYSEVYTLRSDSGLIMREGVGKNIDGAGQYYSLVTGDYADDYYTDCQFKEFFVDAKPYGTVRKFPLAYYLDARLTTYGQEDVTLQGEIISLGLIEIGDQNVMLERIIPKIDRTKGRMIRFVSRGTVTDCEWEIYAFMVIYSKQNTRVSKYTVGA
jgi:hypothetical protein